MRETRTPSLCTRAGHRRVSVSVPLFKKQYAWRLSHADLACQVCSVCLCASRPAPSQELNVSHAFHSPLMEPMLESFRTEAGRVHNRRSRKPNPFTLQTGGPVAPSNTLRGFTFIKFRGHDAQVSSAKLSAPKVRFFSTVTGKEESDLFTGPDYWVRHVSQAVRFADGMAALEALSQGAPEAYLEVWGSVAIALIASNYWFEVTRVCV